MISAEVVWDLQSFDALAAEWDALDSLGVSDPCTSLAWTSALLTSHVEDSDTVFAVVLRSQGRVVAIVPALMRRERVLGSFDIAALDLLCDLTPSHSDLLRDEDRPDIVPAFFDAIATLPCRWDVLRIRRLLEASTVSLQVAEYLPRSGLGFRIRREQPAFMLELAGSYEEFLASRSAKFRNYLRRKTRQLESLGRLRIARAGNDLSVADAFEQLLAIEVRSWKHGHGTAISAVSRQREFYRLLCEGAHRSRRLHLMLMYLGDVPIAFNLGIVIADRYSYLKTSFDERLRQASPATVLRARLVESLIADGIQTLDFPGQPYQWERQWAETLRWRRSVVVFNRTPRGMLYRLLTQVRGLARSRESGTVSYADPRELGGAP